MKKARSGSVLVKINIFRAILDQYYNFALQENVNRMSQQLLFMYYVKCMSIKNEKKIPKLTFL